MARQEREAALQKEQLEKQAAAMAKFEEEQVRDPRVAHPSEQIAKPRTASATLQHNHSLRRSRRKPVHSPGKILSFVKKDDDGADSCECIQNHF